MQVNGGVGGVAGGADPGLAGSPASTGATGTAAGGRAAIHGGRFDFDDGGTYCGGWEDGKAHGHGVCTGPKGQGAYSGSWHYGFEVTGVYTWPSGSNFEGQWQNGKRHGLGVETRGRWVYRGEWTQGFKGRYGVRQSATSNARYEGTWANGLQDGYGSETYADGGTYQGQWLRGMRHGYGVRASAPFGLASHTRPDKGVRASMVSLRSQDAGGDAATDRDRRVDDARGGFVLKARSDEPPARRRSLVEKTGLKKSILSGLKIRRSTGDLDKRGHPDSIRSTASSASWVSTESSQSGITSASVHTDSNASFVVQDEQLDASVTETYMGEWKNDKRSGFGISERSDGLRYEGEWFANKKYGYGVTTLRDGTKEEGKYKNNVLVTSQKKKHLFLIRSAKFRERIDAAVSAAQRASKIALQKADIAISRTATARGKAELADTSSDHAREDSDIARDTARQFAPDFHQPGLEKMRPRLPKYQPPPPTDVSLYRQINASPTIVPPADEEHPPPASKPYMNRVGAGDLGGRLHNAVPSINVMQQQLHMQQQLQQQQLQQQQQQLPPPAPEPAPQPEEPAYAPPPPMGLAPTRGTSLRRNSRVTTTESPAHNYKETMNDRFEYYNRPPSRDSSVDRYTRATNRLMGSRQSSVDKPAPPVTAVPGALGREASQDRTLRAPSTARGLTPAPGAAGNGAAVGAGVGQPYTVPMAPGGQAPFEDVLLRKRTLGQDIIPSPGQPKRTESLYIGGQTARAPKPVPAATPMQRKKSLPDVQGLPNFVDTMSREEASVLSSARREEVRRMAEESERLRANPLLYLVSPQMREWFSRQQLVLVVLFINISLAIMFFKLLT